MPSTRRLCLCLALATLAVGCGQGAADPAGRLAEPTSAAVTDEDPGRSRPVVSADRAALPPVTDVAAAPETTSAASGTTAAAGAAPGARTEDTTSTGSTAQRAERPALTPPGTVLDLGTAGVATHDRTEGALVTVTPQVVRQGRAEDLARFDLDAHLSLLQPVYVEVSYANIGEPVIATPTLGLRLEARTAAGRQATRLNVVGGFPSCAGAGSLELRPGDAVTDCVVFLLPDGDPLRSVSWQGRPDQGALTWTISAP